MKSRDRIVGNNLITISHWAISQYHDVACTALDGGYIAAGNAPSMRHPAVV